jgi:hypothetical protein
MQEADEGAPPCLSDTRNPIGKTEITAWAAANCMTMRNQGADVLIGPLFYDNVRNAAGRSGDRPLRFCFNMHFAAALLSFKM